MNLVRFNRHPFYSGLFNGFENDFHTTKTNCHAPAVNILEDEKQFLLEFAIPGMKKEDFKINLENQVLTVSSEMKEENEEVKSNYTRREFGYNSFSRSFTVPKNIVADKIKADYKDGILNISVPKDEKTKLSREIKVA
jgi:HSP20 family protein